MENRLQTVMAMMSNIREMKNHFHRLLVVIRMSIMVMDILAVASADGVIWNVTHSIFKAFFASSGDRVA